MLALCYSRRDANDLQFRTNLALISVVVVFFFFFMELDTARTFIWYHLRRRVQMSNAFDEMAEKEKDRKSAEQT